MVRVLGIGDNTVDIYVDQDVQFPGGNAVNVAVMMKRLGAEASYLGCIGTDFLGALIKDALAAEGIDTSHMRVIAGPNSWSRIRHRGQDRVFDGSHPNVFVPTDREALSRIGTELADVQAALDEAEERWLTLAEEADAATASE